MRFRLSAVALLIALLSGSVMAQDPHSPQKTEDVATVEKEFKSVEGRFTVLFPGTPKLLETTANTPIGPVKTHMAILETPSAVYYVSYSDIQSGPETPDEIKAGLDSSRDQVIANGNRLISENDVTVAGVGGRELLVEKSGSIMRVRFFYFKKRLFQLIIGAPAELAFRNGKSSPDPADRTELFETASKRFFESFKLTQ